MKILNQLWAVTKRLWVTLRRLYRSWTRFLPSRRAELKQITYLLGSLDHIVVGVFQANFPGCLLSLNDNHTITIRHPNGKKYTTMSFDAVADAMIDDGVNAGTKVLNIILDDAHKQFLGLPGMTKESIHF